MKHIVSFSSGLSSAVACERVLKRYGRDHVDIVFMDTLIEDDDNYRFMADCEKRWEQEVIVLREGRTPYQVARDAQIIPNDHIAPCTFKLKIEPFKAWLSEKPAPLTVHIGYDYMEIHRCAATEKAYGEHGWKVDFPLLWKPMEARPYPQVVREDWAIEPPRMYEFGYTHANCGGCCVKQGKGDWLRTLKKFPARFAQAEKWEQGMRNHPVREKYAMIRTETVAKGIGGLPLAELRQNYSDARQEQLFEMDTTAPCVVCDIGGMLSEEEECG